LLPGFPAGFFLNIMAVSIRLILMGKAMDIPCCATNLFGIRLLKQETENNPES